MKVEELIKELSEYDPNLEVMVAVWVGDQSRKYPIDGTDLGSDNRPQGSSTFIKVVVITLD